MEKLKIGYCRVSSREQAINSNALDQQIARVRPFVEELFFDIDSGSKDTRVNFKKIQDLVESGKVESITVTRLDRLTRSLITLRKFIDICRSNDVSLKSLDESIDTSSSGGKFYINMLGSLAEMETDRLSERVKHGWKYLRKSHKAVNYPFGYKIENSKYVLDHDPFLCLIDSKIELSKYQLARELIDTHLEIQSLRLTLRKINEKYGILTFSNGRGRMGRGLFRFSPTGLQSWFVNPVLRGHTSYLDGKEIYYNTHTDQILMTEEEYEEINKIREKNYLRKGFGTSEKKYRLTGFVYCAECRSSCYSVAGSRGKQPGYNHYFQCKNWRARACNNKAMIRMETLEQAVFNSLCDKAQEILKGLESPIEKSPIILDLENQLVQLKKIAYPNQAIIDAIADLDRQINEEKVRQESSDKRSQEQRKNLVKVFSDPNFWNNYLLNNMTNNEVNQLLSFYVSKVWIKDGNVVKIDLLV